jgi:ParB-like chromosome segregation protein Spo0J
MAKNQSETIGQHEPREIHISKIVPSRENPRKDMGDMQEFTRSLDVMPSMEYPIIVEAVGKDSYRIIDGHRRYHAARDAGFETLYCDVRHGLSEFDKRLIRVRIDAQHKNWNDPEQYKAMAELYRDWLMERKGHQADRNSLEGISDFAALIGVPEDKAFNAVLIGLTPAALIALEQNQGKHAALYIAQQETEEAQQEFRNTVKELSDKTDRNVATLSTDLSRTNTSRAFHKPKKNQRGKRLEIPNRTVLEAKKVFTVNKQAKEDPQRASRTARDNIEDAIRRSAEYDTTIVMQLPKIVNIEHMRSVYAALTKREQAIREIKKEITKVFREKDLMGGS